MVVEADLIDALRHGPLGGAALDVYHQEPLWRDHPFISELDNVIITPEHLQNFMATTPLLA